MVNLIAKIDTQKNPTLLTPWSIIHFFTGVIAGLLVRHMNLDFIWSLVVYIILNLIYEAKDFFFMNGKDSWQNSIVDILTGILGYLWVTKTVVSTKMVIFLSAILYAVFVSSFLSRDGKTWSLFFDSWHSRD